jgi:sigma-B regulation protein RsbU (phosphoserine phosphatase)
MSDPAQSNHGSTARLILRSGDAPRTILLAHLPFTIGRGTDSGLTLQDPRISREHALICLNAEGYFIRDLGSKHGTLVNGLAIATAPYRLRSRDEITLGTSGQTLIFEEVEDNSTTRSLLAQMSHTGLPANDLETLTLFLKAAQSLSSYGALSDVLRTMLDYTIRLTHAERGFVFLGPSPDTFVLGHAQDNSGKPLADQSGVSQTILREAATCDRDFILGDASDGQPIVSHASLVFHSIRSVAAIPLRGAGTDRLLGLLYLDSHSSTHRFSQTGKEILHVIAQQAATLLENLQMLEAEREATLLRKELEIAASIQRQIIPQTLPEFPFARVTARSLPCTGVGGDFYDLIPTPDGFVTVVADVCGKGIPAALLAAMVQGMVHSQISSGASLLDCINAVNRFVCLRAPVEKYLTLVILRYTHHADGPAQVELINGGHIQPIVIRSGGKVEFIPDGDMPVGLLSFATFHTIAFTLAPGERIVLLSDGISEAENPAGEQFANAELANALTKPDLVPALFSALEHFTQGAHAQDDQTVLAIECAAP